MKSETRKAKRIDKSLKGLLEPAEIDDAGVTGIGPRNKQILKAWGIEDASDVNPESVRIKGFGPVKQQALLDWRRDCETTFRFDPTLPVDQGDLRALEQELAQKAASLKVTLQS